MFTMQGIFLALLIVCATAQSYYPYETQQRTSTPRLATYTTRIAVTQADYQRTSLLYQNNFGRVPAPNIASRSSPSPRFPTSTNYPQARPRPGTAPTRDTQQPVWSNSKPAGTNLPNTYAPNKFNANLFKVIAGPLSQRNVVYSPISLQLLLAFVSIGADGETYNQIRNALGLHANNRDTVAFFQKLWTQLNAGNVQLAMANKMYYSREKTLLRNVQELASNFNSEIEAIDFRSPYAAASINNWVAQKTQNIIRELVVPAQLDAQTQAMLVNAIHFKAKWAKEFSTRDTEKQKFYVTPQRAVSVDMMYSDDSFNYGEFPELDATGVELKYANSNISMMILLPNKPDGLADMEQRLNDVDLKSLSARMRLETVTIRIPKFSIDFDIDMRHPLNQLGITDLFNENASLKGFFYQESAVVSQVQHKAFLNVNEAGSEAAAASFIKLIPLSLPNRIIRFTADHPFMFAIRSPQAVLFIGHVVKI